MTPLLLAALLWGAPADARCLPGPDALTGPPTAVSAPTDSLHSYWEEALPFARFYAEVEARAALWERNYTGGEVPEALLERARSAIGAGPFRLLAVAVDGCSDSVNTLPYLALLADDVTGLELRVLEPAAGRSLMEARPTADGRAATPTVILLDESFDDAGCFVERPRPLKEWIAEQEAAPASNRGVYEGKMRWYDEDAGRSTLEEVVGLMESAAAGNPVCRG